MTADVHEFEQPCVAVKAKSDIFAIYTHLLTERDHTEISSIVMPFVSSGHGLFASSGRKPGAAV
jgi:hypothetical protein